MSVQDGWIDFEGMLLKLEELFKFTSETALNEEKYSIQERVAASKAAAKIADVLLSSLELSMMGAFLDLDEYGDPSLGPDSWEGGVINDPPPPPESVPEDGDDSLNPDDMDLD